MKIAMFSDNFYPELSGISDSIVMSARELAALGHEVVIYAPKYSRGDFLRYNVPVEEIDLGPKVKVRRLFSIPYPGATQQSRLAFLTFLRWISLSAERPDIIHTHLFFGVGFEGLVASRMIGIPLVGTSHTPIVEFMRYSPIESDMLARLASHFVSWYYNRCDLVTAPSRGILDEMKECGFWQPSRVISNPVDLQLFQPVSDVDRSVLKRQFGLSDFTVIYTGRLATEKHIDIVIRAIAELKQQIPDITFAITGHGDAENSLKQLAEELGVADKVRFFGTLKLEDHVKVYQASDVFTIASTAETQSLSLMKAMAVEIPVIGARARALPEYINEHNGFLVEPGDVAGFAEKILYLFHHPEVRKSLGREGRKLTQQFLPGRIAAVWARAYEATHHEFFSRAAEDRLLGFRQWVRLVKRWYFRLFPYRSVRGTTEKK